MIRTDRQSVPARLWLFTVHVVLFAFVLAFQPVPARADDPPGEKPDGASEEMKEKAADAKEHAAEAKEAGQEKATAAKKAAKDANKKAKETKKTTATKAKTKGESVSQDAKAAAGTMPVKPDVEPQHVQVQHILIGFAGSIPGKGITRTQEEAKKLAYEILARARQGEDFDGLVRQYTDDSPPGIYGMSGTGVAPAAGEYPRNGMVPAFGNVGFAISPGNIGIADFDAKASPYGYHIIKRLK
jgi:hypothetical protein